jgi:hypothetical protein
VTRAWEGTIVMEASVQEAAVVRESATALIRDAEAQVALAKRETQERVSRVQTERTTTLASAHGEV